MPNRPISDQLLSHFLESNAKHWVRFVPALPLQAAYYYDAHFGRGVLHRYLLHLTKQGSTCRIALEIGSHTWSRGGLIFDVSSTAREIALDVHGLDFAGARWFSLEDPFVRKAHEIVLDRRSVFGLAPTAWADCLVS